MSKKIRSAAISPCVQRKVAACHFPEAEPALEVAFRKLKADERVREEEGLANSPSRAMVCAECAEVHPFVERFKMFELHHQESASTRGWNWNYQFGKAPCAPRQYQKILRR